jgi:hypothetical protein
VRGVSHETDAVLVADVETDRHRSSSRDFDLALEGTETLDVAAGDDQIGSRMRERAGKRLPQAAAGTGDDRDPAGEIEKLETRVRTLFPWPSP